MKQNQKGFTLIELLAVIVILAVIALIATPIVLSTIETARKGAAEDSAYGALKAVSEAYLEAQITNTSGNLTAEYDFSSDASNSFEITISGTRPTAGTVTITDNNVTISNDDHLIIKGYSCEGNSNNVTCTKIS